MPRVSIRGTIKPRRLSNGPTGQIAAIRDLDRNDGCRNAGPWPSNEAPVRSGSQRHQVTPAHLPAVPKGEQKEGLSSLPLGWLGKPNKPKVDGGPSSSSRLMSVGGGL